jgi:glycosyltransferase involved in cell wall biosynthesis
LVIVLTPVYNGEKLLAESIRSVLAQTHTNFEYTIVNNRSTDRTMEIAEAFARQDSRVRVHNNVEFLSVVDNHNKAFSLIPDRAKYCKVVGADDWLYPNCVAEMVKLAEQYPSVGMVTSYVLCGNRVGWDGLPYPSTCMKGRDVCRLRLLKGVKVFGGPSASLLRCSVVKEYQPFYKVGNYHGDTEAYLDLLQKYDFGFLHQVLSYNRKGGEDSRTTGYLQRVNSYPAADVEELSRFGPIYLSEEEQRLRLGQATQRYYRFLAQSVLELRNKEFWDYHRGRMRELGPGINYFKLSRYVVYRILDAVLNPKRTIEGLVKRILNRRQRATDVRPAVRTEAAAYSSGK